MTLRIESVDHSALVDLIHDAGRPVPVEQSPQWAAMEDRQPGRTHWRCLVAYDGATPVAALSLMRYRGRFMTQLSAKHGPVWLTGEPTPELERELRTALADYARREDPKAALVRLHARDAEGCAFPLVATPWDRTVLVPLERSDDELMKAMSQSGRRYLRRGLANEDVTVADESAISRADFEREIYAVFAETAARGGFELLGSDNYYDILEQLRPEHARLYTARIDGDVVAWILFTRYDGVAVYYYAASSHEARDSNAVFKLLWTAMRELRDAGDTVMDFYGISSPRAPELASLDQFKLKWTHGEFVDVPGAWDVVLRPGVLALFHGRRRAQAGARTALRELRALPARAKDALGKFRKPDASLPADAPVPEADAS